jgi:hypothetical protein
VDAVEEITNPIPAQLRPELSTLIEGLERFKEEILEKADWGDNGLKAQDIANDLHHILLLLVEKLLANEDILLLMVENFFTGRNILNNLDPTFLNDILTQIRQTLFPDESDHKTHQHQNQS